MSRAEVESGGKEQQAGRKLDQVGKGEGKKLGFNLFVELWAIGLGSLGSEYLKNI